MSFKKTIYYSLIFFLTACGSSKDIAYLQNTGQDEIMTIVNNQAPVIKPDDLLSIQILSSNPELAVPYNMLTTVSNNQKHSSLLGYLVDKDGFLTLPVLGKIKAVGMTRDQLAEYIGKLLEGAMPDPSVLVKNLNFKVSVLGEVKNPGAFNIDGDRITLFDAIGMAGDLTIYGKRENVILIREKNDKREVVRLDLRSKDLFSSPYFYLQQNDVVYVEPNKAKINSSSDLRQNYPLIISTVSALTSVTTVILYLTGTK